VDQRQRAVAKLPEQQQFPEAPTSTRAITPQSPSPTTGHHTPSSAIDPH